MLGEPFQDRVARWMIACFGLKITHDRVERNHRFLEEALELAQACECTASEAHQLVDYVFGRPVGQINQEIGGVLVTLAALCTAHGSDMALDGEVELRRIWTKIEAIRAKQAAKPKHSPPPDALADQARYTPGATLAGGVARGGLAELVKQAAEAYAALSPVDRALHYVRQRQSYVRAELRIPDGKLGGMTPERIDALPKDPAVVLADEVERLRGLMAAKSAELADAYAKWRVALAVTRPIIEREAREKRLREEAQVRTEEFSHDR